MTLAIASSGKVRKVISASLTSSRSRITITPTRVSGAENSVTTPLVTSWLSASTSLVMREIRTPGLRRVKKPIDIDWMWPKSALAQVLQGAGADPADQVGLGVGAGRVEQGGGDEGDDGRGRAR